MDINMLLVLGNNMLRCMPTHTHTHTHVYAHTHAYYPDEHSSLWPVYVQIG